MSDFNVLKEYYIRYLKQVRGNSDSSVNHYIGALQTISKYLVERGKIANTIYEIDNVGELEIIREYLYQQPDFVEKNERGRRMYSAGLNNYIRFAEGMEFAEAGERATVLDFAVPVEKSVCVETMEWRRNRIIKKQALEFAQYKCEVDSGHITFIAAATMKPYMEGHHAVPMKEQNNFDVSLDVYANIVCLCPICHRLLHYGKVSRKREVLEQIYIARDDRLQNSGIYLTKDQFLNIAE